MSLNDCVGFPRLPNLTRPGDAPPGQRTNRRRGEPRRYSRALLSIPALAARRE